MLAGKFKDAEALEQAYIELKRNLENQMKMAVTRPGKKCGSKTKSEEVESTT